MPREFLIQSTLTNYHDKDEKGIKNDYLKLVKQQTFDKTGRNQKTEKSSLKSSFENHFHSGMKTHAFPSDHINNTILRALQEKNTKLIGSQKNNSNLVIHTLARSDQ